MKAKHSRFYWLFWAAGLILIMGVLLCICRVDSFSVCEGCRSNEECWQWGVELPFGIRLPLVRLKTRIVGSKFLADMLAGSHGHQWVGVGTQSYHPFVLGVLWAQMGDLPERRVLIMTYEKDPAFRTFILGRINVGSISKADFTAAALLSAYVVLGENPEERRLRALSNEWLEAFKQPAAEPR